MTSGVTGFDIAIAGGCYIATADPNPDAHRAGDLC